MSNKIYYVKCTTLEQRDSLLAYAKRRGAADNLFRLDVKREPYLKLYNFQGVWKVGSDRGVYGGEIELTPDSFKRKVGKLWPSKSKVARKPSQLDRIEATLSQVHEELLNVRSIAHHARTAARVNTIKLDTILSGATFMQELDKAAADQCKTPTLDQVVEVAFDWFDTVDNGPGSDYDKLRARLSKLFKQ
jgi:hypothetical protein